MTRLKRWLGRLSRAFFRPLGFFSKEFIQVWRQPRLILTLVAGPFLVLLLFGLGYSAHVEPVPTILVVPPDSGLPTDRASYENTLGPPFALVGVTQDRDQAVRTLEQREVGAVLVVPDRASETIQAGQHPKLDLLYNELDPMQRTWLEYYGYVQTQEINRQLLMQAVVESRQQARSDPVAAVAASPLLLAGRDAPPDVIVAPFEPTSQNVAPTSPGFVAFYAPGVLALLVQHVAVTFTALALVRERLRGTVELFRVAPVSPREVLTGKYLSYFVQTAVLTAILAGLMILALDVPVLGSFTIVFATLALLIGASLGIGLFISAISRTETQAVQFSLLVLLAAVFFSGFFLPLANLLKPVWVVSYALPVTYGIRALQEVMLRGATPEPWVLGALGGMAVGLLLLTALVFRRQFKTG